MKLIFLSVLITFFSLSNLHARRGGKIPLQEALRAELNSMLKVASELHQACYKKDEVSTDKKVKKLIKNIVRAEKKSTMARTQRLHLVKMLDAAKNKLEMSQSLRGDNRKKKLQGAFADIVQIAQVFDLEKYKIFFCQKDRSVWLQTSWKPQNPIHPDRFGNCGKLVP